jgi:hypothetical protein
LIWSTTTPATSNSFTTILLTLCCPASVGGDLGLNEGLYDFNFGNNNELPEGEIDLDWEMYMDDFLEG